MLLGSLGDMAAFSSFALRNEAGHTGVGND